MRWRTLSIAATVAWPLAAVPAGAQMTEPILSDLEYLARQVAVCYATGQMEFSQRVLHRRFVHDYLSGCRATSRQQQRIEESFLYARGSGTDCNPTRFFEVKEELQQARQRQRC